MGVSRDDLEQIKAYILQFIAVAGTIGPTAGTIGGWTIGSDTLTDTAGMVGMASTVTGGDDVRFWSGNVNRNIAPFRVTESGVVYAEDAHIAGEISADIGDIGGFTIGATNLSAGSITLDSATPAIKMGDATNYMVGAGIFMGQHSGIYKYHVGNPLANYLSWDGTYLVASGQWIASAGLNPALQEWTTSVVFSSTDADTISWTSGTLRLSDGTTYAINAGNTGNMAALTYVYLDIAVSTTAFQVTTSYSTAVGNGKILVAACQNNATAASVIPFSGQQPIIDGGAQIAALSILAGSIAAGAVTASKISVINLAAITATCGALTVDNKLTMNGASSAIAIGTTPPTGKNNGTGVWIDRDGAYALLANIQQATLTSAGLSAGAGAVVADASGITFAATSTYVAANAIKFKYSSSIASRIYQLTSSGRDNFLMIENNSLSSHDSEIDIFSDAPSSGGYLSVIDIATKIDGNITARFRLRSDQEFEIMGSEAYIQSDPNGNMLASHTIGATTVVYPVNHYDPLGAFLTYPGLQACWYGVGYDGTGSTVMMLDRSGSGHHLTVSGPASSSYESGNMPAVHYLNFVAAESDYCYRANETLLNQADYIDVMVWTYLATTPADGSSMFVIKNADTTEAWSIFVYNNSGTITWRFRVYNSSGVASSVVPTETASAGGWYFLRAKFQASVEQSLIINGTKYTVSPAASMRAPAGNFVLGKSGSTYLNGRIAMAALSNTVVDNTSPLAVFQSTRDYFGV